MMTNLRHSKRDNRRRGAVLATTAVALIALLGVSALAIDITRLHAAAQRAQAVADASAFAGGTELPDPYTSVAAAFSVAAGNVVDHPEWSTTVGNDDVTYYPPGSTIYNPLTGEVITTLGGTTHALMAVARVDVDFSLARVVGIDAGERTRFAVVARGAATGAQVVPMWIAAGSPELAAGDYINLFQDSCAIPGSFGFLDFSDSGVSGWFQTLLSGYDVPDELAEAAFVEMGGMETAYTGASVGQWVAYLDTATGQDAGTARLERALNDPIWSTQSFPGSPDNPRRMMVPLVNYVEGTTGTNARFVIVGLAEVWLESINQGSKEISTKFIDYRYFSGGGGDFDPRDGGTGGVYITKPLA